MRWTKTAGSASDKFQETSVFNETLRIERIARTQGGRYYCKAENGVGVPAIKSIRVDVQCELRPLEALDPDGTAPPGLLTPQGWEREIQWSSGKVVKGWKDLSGNGQLCVAPRPCISLNHFCISMSFRGP